MFDAVLVGKLTLYSNMLMVASEVCVLFFVVRWWAQADSMITEHVLTVWALISIGYAVRIGYWAIGTFDGGDVDYMRCDLDGLNCILQKSTYPSWAIEWRWAMLVPATMVVLGNLMFIRYIEGFSRGIKVLLILALALIAAVPVFLSY